jgi:hypothetical protein
MIVVHGIEETFVREVVAQLNSCGHGAVGVNADAHLFSEVCAYKARAVVGIVGVRGYATEDERQNAVDLLVSASSAPTSPRVVLVTPGPVDAPHVESLKRSGAPYVVVSSAGIRRLAPPAYLRGSRIWLSRELLEPQHALVTEAALMATLAVAVNDDTGTGLELIPSRCSWRQALELTGVNVTSVPNWVAHAAYALGAPALYVANDGVRTRLGCESVAEALGALPADVGAAA